ncbi:hypothetical protein AAFF_G00369780 [Aldrovandia affinis]|uniref:Butyrophilin subfamily 1 member A1-like n=1 Tax=Aldrovandia affinis TaxID=143900 RepID=A0AAD7R595_9TELE|nr:hypothetical protein AAFF_G00369780 [Aldrovandia affinis]
MKRKYAGALICMLTALAVPLSAASAGDFSVSVPSAPVSVWLGDSVTLPCSVTPPMDVSPLEVGWYRPPHHHAPFLLYKDRRIDINLHEPQYWGRVFLVGLGSGVGGLEGGNASLSLRNVTVADSGEYGCYVNSGRWYDTGSISLQVNKLGSIPVLSVHPGVGGQQVNVSCVSDGWSPKPSLIWRNREGRELKDQQGLFYSTDPQGLVTVSGWLLFSPSDSGWLSCTVSLSGGDSRESRVAPHTPGTDESVGCIARFIILLVLSVSAISVVTVLFIRSRKTSLTNSGKDSVELETKALLAEGWKDIIKHAVNFELDNETAHMHLKISGAKSVSFTLESQNRTSSKVFTHHPCVLGKEGFSSGQHYWEVEVEDPVGREVKKAWRVGVAAASAPRHFYVPLSTEKGFWLFSYDEAKGCHANTHPEETVFRGLKLKGLGVLLDCDEHTVSFYDPEQKKLLFIHRELRKGRMYPLFSPGVSDHHPLKVCDLKVLISDCLDDTDDMDRVLESNS